MGNKLMKLAEKLIKKIEETEWNFFTWLFAFTAIIFTRLFVENMNSHLNGSVEFYSFYGMFSSFLITYLILGLILHKILKVEFKKAFNLLLWGYWLIIFPPIIDHYLSQGQGLSSFYIFDSLPNLIRRFFTFFGDRPDFGVTYGTRIEVLLCMALLFVYSFLKTRKFFRSLSISILSYVLLFIFGTFPSWITIFWQGFSKGFFNVNSIDVAQMFLSPFNLFSLEISDPIQALVVKTSLLYFLILSCIIVVGLFIYQKDKFWAILKNSRPTQIVYHLGLLVVGLGLGMIYNEKSLAINLNFFDLLGFLVLVEAIVFSWLASVLVNDVFDQKIDRLTNRNRPLIKEIFSLKEYWILAILFFLSVIFLSSLFNPKIIFLFVIYQTLAWVYSAPPFRLKRFAYLSTFLSAVASITILLSGYVLISPDQSLTNLPPQIITLLILAFTLSLPIKDFKDIEGDKANGVFTVPVILGENWGKMAVGGGILISFVLSVILLNEPRLFWWAILFGSLSFWLVNKMKKNPAEGRINYRNIFWWMIGTVSAYGIILVKIIFL